MNDSDRYLPSSDKKESYIETDNLRLEIAVLKEEIKAFIPSIGKFTVPSLMMQSQMQGSSSSNSGGNDDMYVEIYVPYEYTFAWGDENVPAGTRFIVGSIGANLNDMKIVGRYDANTGVPNPSHKLAQYIIQLIMLKEREQEILDFCYDNDCKVRCHHARSPSKGRVDSIVPNNYPRLNYELFDSPAGGLGGVAGGGDLSGGLGGGLGGLGGGLGDLGGLGNIGDLASGLSGGLSDMMGNLGDLTGGLTDSLGNLGDLAGNLTSGLGDLAGNLTSGLGDLAGGLTDALGNQLSDLTTGLSSLVGGSGLTGALSGDISGMLGNLGGLGGLGDLAGNLGNIGDLASGLTGSINDMIGNLGGLTGNLTDSLSSMLGGNLGGLVGIPMDTVSSPLGNITNDIANGISNTLGNATSLGGLPNVINNTMNSVVGNNQFLNNILSGNISLPKSLLSSGTANKAPSSNSDLRIIAAPSNTITQ